MPAISQPRAKDFSQEINSFRTANTKDSPITMKDDEMPLLLNFMPIGTSLYTVPGVSAILASTPLGTVIKRMWAYNLNGAYFLMVACTDGSLYRFDSGWTRTTVAAAGTFVNPRFEQWKYTNVLIIDPNGYWDYDNATLTKHTTLGAPSAGTCIAVFKGRVFVANGRLISFSAPDSFTDWQAASSGGTVTDNYPDLQTQINNLVATQDYLYCCGDHATHVIGGVQVYATGSTVFQLFDAVPKVGALYPDTVSALGNLVFEMGDIGVHTVTAGSFDLLSQYLDGLFPLIDTTFQPVGFFTKIFNKNIYALLVRVASPIDGSLQKWLMCFYEGRWFFISFGSAYDFTYACQKTSTTDTLTYASYSNNIVQLFTGQSVMTKKLRTKAMNFGTPLNDKQVLRTGAMLATQVGFPNVTVTATLSVIGDIASAQVTATFLPGITTWYNALGNIVLWQNSLLQYVDWTAPTPLIFGAGSCDGRGKRIQLDYEETSNAVYVFTGFLLDGQIGAAW